MARQTGGEGDLDAPESMLGFLLSQLAGAVRAHTADALAPMGISPRGLGLLLAVHDRPGSSQTALRRRLRIDRTTMSQLVDDLTEAGFIIRGVAAGDRRSSDLQLTGAGLAKLRRGHALAVEAERALTTGIDLGRIAELKTTLARILGQLPDSDVR